MYREASVTYEKLLAATEDEQELDQLSVNYLAARASLAMIEGGTAEGLAGPAQQVDRSYETQYNYACYLAASRPARYQEALDLLDTCEAWAREALHDEGVVEEAIDQELRQFVIQKAYILQQIGRTDEATALLEAAIGRMQSAGIEDSLTLLARFNCPMWPAGEGQLPGTGGLLPANSFNSLPTRPQVEALLGDATRLTLLQRNFALYNLAVTLLFEGKLGAASRVLRRLLAFRPLQRLATILLYLSGQRRELVNTGGACGSLALLLDRVHEHLKRHPEATATTWLLSGDCVHRSANNELTDQQTQGSGPLAMAQLWTRLAETDVRLDEIQQRLDNGADAMTTGEDDHLLRDNRELLALLTATP